MNWKEAIGVILITVTISGLVIGFATGRFELNGDDTEDGEPILTTEGVVIIRERVKIIILVQDWFDRTDLTSTSYVHVIQAGDDILGKYETERDWDTVTMTTGADLTSQEYEVGEKVFLYTSVSGFEEALYEYVVPASSTDTAQVSVTLYTMDTSASDTDLVTAKTAGVISASANYDVSDDGTTNSWSYEISSGETDSGAPVQYTNLELANNKYETYHTIGSLRCNASTFVYDGASANERPAGKSYNYYDGTYWYVYVDLYDTIDHAPMPNMGGQPQLTLIDGFPAFFNDAGSSSDGSFTWVANLSGLTADTEIEIGIVLQTAMSTIGSTSLTESISEVIDIQA